MGYLISETLISTPFVVPTTNSQTKIGADKRRADSQKRNREGIQLHEDKWRGAKNTVTADAIFMTLAMACSFNLFLYPNAEGYDMSG